jgi:hypothetical protein
VTAGELAAVPAQDGIRADQQPQTPQRGTRQWVQEGGPAATGGREPGSPNARKGVMPTDCPNAAANAFGYYEPDKDVRGADWMCAYIKAGSVYQLEIGVLSAPVTTPDEPNAQALSFPGADRAWIDDGCTSASGPCWGIDVVIGNQTLRIWGGVSRDETIPIARKVLEVG